MCLERKRKSSTGDVQRSKRLGIILRKNTNSYLEAGSEKPEVGYSA